MCRLMCVVGVLLSLAAAGVAAPERAASRPADLESLVADLATVVADLRRQVGELRSEVESLRERLSPADPAPDADAVETAIRRGEIVVGMTWREARRARPQWKTKLVESRGDKEVFDFGEPQGTDIAPRLTITFLGGKVADIRVNRLRRTGGGETGGPLH